MLIFSSGITLKITPHILALHSERVHHKAERSTCSREETLLNTVMEIIWQQNSDVNKTNNFCNRKAWEDILLSLVGSDVTTCRDLFLLCFLYNRHSFWVHLCQLCKTLCSKGQSFLGRIVSVTHLRVKNFTGFTKPQPVILLKQSKRLKYFFTGVKTARLGSLQLVVNYISAGRWRGQSLLQQKISMLFLTIFWMCHFFGQFQHLFLKSKNPEPE